MVQRPRFDEAPEPGAINFAPGQPSADLIPLDALRAASEDYFLRAEPLEFNYGEKPGDGRFRAALAAFLQRHTGQETDPDGLFLSGGNSQGLNLACQRFSAPGDTVLVEDPSFFLAFGVFRDHGLRVVGVPMDGSGFDMEALERAIAQHRPSLVYTIPSFQNPTGQTLTEEKRERLAALSIEHGFTVLADEVYQLLPGSLTPPPPLGSWAGRGHVVSLGSFSKLIAPGLRLGWLQTDPDRIRTLTDTGFIRSGGNVNHFASHVVRHFLDDGALDRWLPVLRAAYRERSHALDQALDRELGEQVRWHRPEGGYFHWVEWRDGRDTASWLEAARAAGTGFIPGRRFSPDGNYSAFLRLSFAHYGPAELDEGIRRLALALRS